MKTTKTNKIPTQTHTKYVSGFTLIELLIVIAIIGILSTIIIISINNARAKARDARRDSDIKTIQNALEVYYVDHGRYPEISIVGDGWHSNPTSWANLSSEMGVTLPQDPISSGNAPWQGGLRYGYSARLGSLGCPPGQAYVLVYNYESGPIPSAESPGVKRCTTGSLYRAGAGSKTVGISSRQ